MSKRQQRRRSTKRQNPPLRPRAESQTSQGVTVFWMTSLLATVVSEIMALALRLVVWFDASPTLVVFSNLMLLIAAATGAICLLLTPAVLRWRETPPPLPITRFAIAASLLPIVTLVAVMLWGD